MFTNNIIDYCLICDSNYTRLNKIKKIFPEIFLENSWTTMFIEWFCNFFSGVMLSCIYTYMKKVQQVQLYHHQSPTGSMSCRSLSAFRQWQCVYPWCELSVFTYVRVRLAALSVFQGVDWITAVGRGAEADGASVWNEAVYSQQCQHPHDQPLIPRLIHPSPQGSFFTRLHQLSANPG